LKLVRYESAICKAALHTNHTSLYNL
jgi:hypothetical protein